MKKNLLTFFAVLCFTTVLLAQKTPAKPVMAGDCSNLSVEAKTFSNKLNPTNKMMFCGKFDDVQRNTAMQLTGQMDSSGMVTMSPDQAVEKVAKDNNLMAPGKAPAGCPVK